jgi:hypothetical protein
MIDQIASDVVSALLAAAIGTLIFAQIKAIRLSLRLNQVAEIIRSVRAVSYQGFRAESDMRLCDQAKQEVDEILEEAAQSAEHGLKLSREHRNEIRRLRGEVTKLKDSVFSDIFYRALGVGDTGKAIDASIELQKEFRSLARRVLPFWSFLRL